MNPKDLKSFLDFKSQQYESIEFITHDPIQIPHQFSNKKDIEIAAFLSATIAWGNRVSILKSAQKIIELMDDAPYDFILNHQEHNFKNFNGFVHRTFNSQDLEYFVRALQNIYKNHGGLESLFSSPKINLQERIHQFKKTFFELDHPSRTQKHISDPLKGSAAKRINMFLRWMVRKDKNVDFGIWKNISPSVLSCPLDVHTANSARKLNLISRKQNDIETVIELDKSLRKMDKDDPVKYDFALFGIGVFEKSN